MIQSGRAKGMVTMNDSLAELYYGGVIAKDVALERSARPAELLKTFGKHKRK